MTKYNMYSVFVDLNRNKDDTEIPIIHRRMETVSEENAIRLVMCSLSVNKALRESEVRVTATKLSNWKTRKIKCEQRNTKRKK